MTTEHQSKLCRGCKQRFYRPTGKHMTNARWMKKWYCGRRCAFLTTWASQVAEESR